MPRPFRPPAVIVALIIAVSCAALGPAALATALAATAGTLFEAVPFVLVAEALPAGPLRHLATAAGCGCGRAVPGALVPLAIALCWLTFGPAVTLVRCLAGTAVLAYGVHQRRHSHAPSTALAFDPFSELLALAPWAAAAALLGGALADIAPSALQSPGGLATGVLGGVVLGYVAPCGTAAVALAAGLQGHAPVAAWGVLLTGGILPRAGLGRSARHRAWGAPFSRRQACVLPALAGSEVSAPASDAENEPNATPRTSTGRSAFARLAASAALAGLAAGGPHGLVNPRLVPLLWLGAALGLIGLRRRTRERSAALVPAIMLAALFAGAPPPRYAASETELGDGFPGERLAFTGVAQRHGSGTVLERFAITCCRADASPVAVRLAEPLAVANGSWVEARGTLEASPLGLVLRTAAWHRIRAPADPFVYR